MANNSNFSRQYSFTNQRSMTQKRLSIAGVLKPLSIGSISSIANSDPHVLKVKIQYQLQRLEQLRNTLTEQVNNPKYIKVKQRNIVDLKMLQSCTQIHRAYFNRVLYYRNKTMNADVNELNIMFKQYEMQLFTLGQQYRKIKLQLKGIVPNAYPI